MNVISGCAHKHFEIKSIETGDKFGCLCFQKIFSIGGEAGRITNNVRIH